MSESGDFQERSRAFVNWLRDNGASISAKITLDDLRQQNAGRGIVAVEDLDEDEELFSVPRSTMLTTETSRNGEAVLQEVDDPWLSLIVVMALEYLDGSQSRWKPYFDVLPVSFDNLMFWSDRELRHLEGSTVVGKIGKEAADATFREQLIPVIERISKAKAADNEELLRMCHRMGSTIMAYGFDLETSSDQAKNDGEEWEEDSDAGETLPKGMVPLADMLNADADRNNAKLFYEDDKVVMKTIKPVKAGEELYNDFGSLPRADLLRRYGYLTDNYAQYDVVEIPADLIKERAGLRTQDVDERWQYAEEQGVLDDGYDVSRASSEEGQFPEELCVLLNLLALPRAEFEKVKNKDKIPKPDLTTNAKKLLRTILVYRYAAYPGNVDQMHSDVSLNDRRRKMAIVVIQGEKQVLQEAVDAISEIPSGKKRSADTLEDEAAAIRQPAKK
ncbi:hypothetical protein DOTSEDRAFT_131367 [Dothistroma septosporum NZE10]|uniref:N-lysine methyltransferase SETD6 n=1 Tax=Dothistroma septosporum (strain NZE10 / CBS 128990) TaxID=675120 RepID=M2Y4Y2_DOTSN|nr:hypothetical protein DOTSEDRAFT_131367 [Dothistroma septosporum NZE10]